MEIRFPLPKIKVWERLVERWQEAARNCATSGFVPKPFFPMQLLGKIITIIWVFIQVGMVHVEGKDFLKQNHRMIVAPNHSSYFDALVVMSILPRPARYMTANDQFAGLGGLRAMVMAACGAFAVDKSSGARVIEPSINMLEKAGPNTTLVIFPEGRISSDGKLGSFKTGISRIGMGCKERIGEEKIAIVPLAIKYRSRDDASAQGGYGRMGFKWRHGVVVTALKPIYLENQPRDEIVAAVYRAIEAALQEQHHVGNHDEIA